MKSVPLLVSALVLALPLACAQTSESPPAASIRGTQLKSPLWYDHIACVSAIDQRSVGDDVGHWDQALALTPGRHSIAVSYHHYVFSADHVFLLDAKPNAKYRVNCKCSADRVQLWIEDLVSGKAVTAVSLVRATGPVERLGVSDTRLIRD